MLRSTLDQERGERVGAKSTQRDPARAENSRGHQRKTWFHAAARLHNLAAKQDQRASVGGASPPG